MRVFLSVLLLAAASFLLAPRLQDIFSFLTQNYTERQVSTLLTRAVFEKVYRPNKWHYTINPMFFVHVSADRLQYKLMAVLNVRDRCVTIEEAENLYVPIFRDFTVRMNSIPIIRPFLGDFPLTPDSLEIALGFVDDDGNEYPPPAIGCANLNKNIVRFNYFTKESVWIPAAEKSVHSIDGLEKLYTEGVPRRTGGSKPKIPTCYYRSRSSPVLDAMFDFGRNFAKIHGLEPVVGRVWGGEAENRPFQFGFRGNQLLSLPEARRLIAKCAKEMLLFSQHSKPSIAYLKERKTWEDEKFAGDFPEKDHVALRISLWDEYVNRVPEPYIAEIRVAGESFKYYTANERQFLVLAYEETWDEAMEFLEQETTSQASQALPQKS